MSPHGWVHGVSWSKVPRTPGAHADKMKTGYAPPGVYFESINDSMLSLVTGPTNVLTA